LARALGYGLARPDELERMATAARVHLGDRFTSEALAGDLAEVYDLALDHRSWPAMDSPQAAPA